MDDVRDNRSFDAGAEIKRYYFILRRRLWLIALIGLLAAGVAFVASKLSTPEYRSATTMLIDIRFSSSDVSVYSSIVTSERLAETYVEIIQSPSVFRRVRKSLELDSGTFLGKISAAPIVGTQLLKITVEHTDKEMAAQIANSLATEFTAQLVELQTSGYAGSKSRTQTELDETSGKINAIREQLIVLETGENSSTTEKAQLENDLSDLNRNYSLLTQNLQAIELAVSEAALGVVQIEPAVAASNPFKPNTLTNTILATVVGIMTALGIIFLLEYLDDAIHSPEQLARRFGIPVLGQILYFDTDEARLIAREKPRSPAAESFRALRINIRYASVDRVLKTILVTSPSPSEGKSTMAANLAVVMAQKGHDVVILDGDLRRPNQHKVFGLRNNQGLSNLFIESLEWFEGMLQETDVPGLSVLPSGPIPPNPSELLDSVKAREILDMAADRADSVIVDAPPTISLTDAIVLSQHVDGVIVTIKVGSTTYGALTQAIDRLRQVGANIIGFVMVGIGPQSSKYGYYYYQYDNYSSYESYFTEPEYGSDSRSGGKKKQKWGRLGRAKRKA